MRSNFREFNCEAKLPINCLSVCLSQLFVWPSYAYKLSFLWRSMFDTIFFKWHSYAFLWIKTLVFIPRYKIIQVPVKIFKNLLNNIKYFILFLWLPFLIIEIYAMVLFKNSALCIGWKFWGKYRGKFPFWFFKNHFF